MPLTRGCDLGGGYTMTMAGAIATPGRSALAFDGAPKSVAHQHPIHVDSLSGVGAVVALVNRSAMSHQGWTGLSLTAASSSGRCGPARRTLGRWDRSTRAASPRFGIGELRCARTHIAARAVPPEPPTPPPIEQGPERPGWVTTFFTD